MAMKYEQACRNIVAEMIKKYRVCHKGFYGRSISGKDSRRDRYTSKVRGIAIRRMIAIGATHNVIAFVLGINECTVRFHTDTSHHEDRKLAAKRRYHARKKQTA